MTERWRKKLGDLDKQSPSDDVFERAKEGPMHAEDPIPRTKTSTRIITAVAAFAVFALAISVFAIPALRMQSGAAGGSSGLFPLWPSQTSDQLRALQGQADVGQASWALEPKLVAERFAHDVMGWTDATLAQDVQPTCLSSGGYFPGTASPGGYVPGTVDQPTSGPYPCAVGSATAVAMPGDLSYSYYDTTGAPSAPGPSESSGDDAFVTFSVLPCGSGENQCIEFGAEHVTVYQPLQQGPGQIWAVMEARSDAITVSTAASQTVRSGASIGATSQYQRGLLTLGYASCGSSVGSSDGRDMMVGYSITLETSLPTSADCSGPQPGYVWAAQATTSLADGHGGIATDPLRSGSGMYLLGLSAVPVTMTFPTQVAETSGATSTSTEPAQTPAANDWLTVKDVYGWTMSYPPDWTAALFGEKDKVGHAVYSGTQGPLSGVVVDVWTDPTANRPPADDSVFPLDAKAVLADGTFRGDGVLFHVDVTTDGPLAPQLSAEEAQTVFEIISSIKFQPWSVGEVRGEWTSVGEVLPSASAQWITFQGEHYFTSIGPPRELFGPAPHCPSGGDASSYEIRETGMAAFTCADGTTAEWDFTTGQAQPGNPQSCTSGLFGNDAELSWDGQLLVRFRATGPGALPSVSPVPTPSP